MTALIKSLLVGGGTQVVYNKETIYFLQHAGGSHIQAAAKFQIYSSRYSYTRSHALKSDDGMYCKSSQIYKYSLCNPKPFKIVPTFVQA